MTNLSPVASGNKTISGGIGLVIMTIVTVILKQMNIEDEGGVISAMIAGWVLTGGLTVVGAIHKWIKSRKKK